MYSNITITDIYGGRAFASPTLPDDEKQAVPAQEAPASAAPSISWLGVLIALVALRVAYEIAS